MLETSLLGWDGKGWVTPSFRGIVAPWECEVCVRVCMMPQHTA